VLDELPVAVLGIDVEGVVAYANRAAERTLACRGGLLGRLAVDALAAPDLHDPNTVEVELEGQHFQLLCGELATGGTQRGKLVVLLPRTTTEGA